MKIYSWLLVALLLTSCRPAATDETKNYAMSVGQLLLVIDFKKLPEPKSYSESGIDGIVFLGVDTREQIMAIRSSNKKVNVEIDDSEIGKGNSFFKPVYDKQLNRFIYGGVTHILTYKIEDKPSLSLLLRFDIKRNKFHIVGFYTAQ